MPDDLQMGSSFASDVRSSMAGDSLDGLPHGRTYDPWRTLPSVRRSDPGAGAVAADPPSGNAPPMITMPAGSVDYEDDATAEVDLPANRGNTGARSGNNSGGRQSAGGRTSGSGRSSGSGRVSGGAGELSGGGPSEKYPIAEIGGGESRAVGGGRRMTRRFDEIGVLGAGGMGEVFKVVDRDLNRVLALKVIRHELVHSKRAMSRFIAEAQVTGQLQHPGIVPVHEVGRLPDGRMYFAMREVRGRDLGSVILEVHNARSVHGWQPGPSGWTFRRLIDAFHKIAETVAYAHSRHVIHRDIKPENILLGDYGEVLVLDWGLARIMGQPDVHEADIGEMIVTDRARDSANVTVVGAVAGTPSYMPPEQATGDRDSQGPHSDVWSLGACLYEILVGRAPFIGVDAESILQQVISRNPEPVPESPDIPEPLRQIVSKSLARLPQDRYRNAGELAKDLEAWLEGARRREQALGLLKQAEERSKHISRLLPRAEALRNEADRLLSNVHPTDPVELKRMAWQRLEEARGLERGSEVLETVVAQLASAALTQAPDLVEAHQFLANHYRRAHARAEAKGNDNAAERYRTLLQAQYSGNHARYLQGEGALTLVTDPPGATVEIFKYVERDRKLVREPFGTKQRTPIRAMPLPMGSYLLVISAIGRLPVRYPVFIRREEHWDGIPPGEASPYAIRLPEVEELDDHEVYVPGGWTWFGVDPESNGRMPRRRVWVDGFAMHRFPVTNGEYLEFLDDLNRRWRQADATRYAPTPHPRSFGGYGAMALDRAMRFTLPTAANGVVIGHDWPVTMLDWPSVTAYASWLTVRSGKKWWLPSEIEWEKAARGVDARLYPMGPHLDPTWCVMGESHDGRVSAQPIDACPEDSSPYGVRGLAGNVRDWCREPYLARGPRIFDERPVIERGTPSHDGPQWRVVRGGSWVSRAEDCTTTWRNGFLDDDRLIDVGFRLVRPFH